MLGHFVPPYWDPGIAIHFSHRVGALLVLFASLATTGLVCSRLRDRLELVRPAALLAALVMVQATLGALTVLSRLNIWLNSVHVVCGALVLTTSLVLTLRSWRGMFAGETVRLTTDPTPVAHAEPVPTPTPVLRSMPAEPASPAIHAAHDVGGVRLQPGRGAQA
jgi:hypothetical protein